MSEALLKKVGRGRTWFGATETIDTSATYRQADQFRGTIATFPNKASATSETLRNSKPVKAIFVRNDSGITLLPKYAVQWTSSARGLSVSGHCFGASDASTECAGIVDDWLPSTGVRNKDYFWVIVEGECLALTSAITGELQGDTTGIGIGDALCCAVSAAASTSASNSTQAGRVRNFNRAGTWTVTQATTGGIAGLFNLNRIGRALSAKTTGNTNAEILVELGIRL